MERRQDRIWTRERARLEGVSRDRLTGGAEFVRVVPGVYVEACWADDLLTRAAAVLHAAPTGALSHWTALAAHGLPVPVATGAPLHLTVRAGGSRPRWARVVTHRSTSLRVWAVDHLRTTGVVTAWCDTAALLAGPARRGARRTGAPDLADLVAAGDALLRRRPGLARDVTDELSSRPGCRGSVVARQALVLLDARAESRPESRLRVLLVLAGLPAPAVQHEVHDARGRFVARVDLAYPAVRVAVEYDGDHHRDRRQWHHDLVRRERLEALGWRVVVLTATDLFGRPDTVVDRVRAAVDGRATATVTRAVA